MVELREIYADCTSDVLMRDTVDGIKDEKMYMFSSVDDRYTCVDNKLVGFTVGESREYDDGIPYMIINVWDIVTGKRDVFPVVNEYGQLVNTGNFNFGLLKLWSVEDGILYATADQGAIVHIDMNTGIANMISDSLEKIDMHTSYRYNFSEYYSNGKIYQYVEDSNHKEDPYIRVLDMKSGNEVERVYILGFYSAMQGNLVSGSIAVTPFDE
ncbi:MAG: hypothetical protein J6M18_02465 [Actinomycetaceae bacterium]|nr:hypothetical protein [Actinomycetaceae bacterium]